MRGALGVAGGPRVQQQIAPGCGNSCIEFALVSGKEKSRAGGKLGKWRELPNGPTVTVISGRERIVSGR